MQEAPPPPLPPRVLLEGWSEAQVVVFVLAIVIAGVALLSYFVIAPEYEKHLQKQFEDDLHVDPAAGICIKTPAPRARHGRNKLHRSPGSRRSPHMRSINTGSGGLARHDVEAAAFSDDDIDSMDSSDTDAKHNGSYGSDTEKDAKILRRRNSKSDAIRQANLSKAEVFRRRVLLRTLEKEIDGAIKETTAHARNAAAMHASPHSTARRGIDAEGCFDKAQVRLIEEHPVECRDELEVIAGAHQPEDIRLALQTLHDVLSFYLSVSHRDMNKVTVFCNSLLQHDGLNHLRGLQLSDDTDIRTIAQQLVEKAVPLIWH